MQRDGQAPPNDAPTALYALLAGAEGCGPAARSARLAHDDELDRGGGGRCPRGRAPCPQTMAPDFSRQRVTL
jgi:hypothetical protein